MAFIHQPLYSRTAFPYFWRYGYPLITYACLTLQQKRDLAAISPTGTGKTLSYLIPIMSLLNAPISSLGSEAGKGVRALIVAPTRELAHQIHNECLKLAEGRKWRIVLFSKASASTLADKTVRDKVGELIRIIARQNCSNALPRCHCQYTITHRCVSTKWIIRTQ